MLLGAGGNQTRPVRVLQLISSLPVGGAEDVVAAMVTGLDPRRFQVQAATLGPPGPVGEELTRAGHPVQSLGTGPQAHPLWAHRGQGA